MMAPLRGHARPALRGADNPPLHTRLPGIAVLRTLTAGAVVARSVSVGPLFMYAKRCAAKVCAKVADITLEIMYTQDAIVPAP
jgi:hypothetical protein